MFVLFADDNFTHLVAIKGGFKKPFNFEFIRLKKYIKRPLRKCLNSTNILPEGTKVNHNFNFPTPFPIREPFVFLVKGKCGKMLNQ